MEKQSEIQLVANVDDKIPAGQAIFLGFQHVLAMDLYIVPIILAGALSMGVSDKSFLIQMTFLAAGIATIIQTKWGLKLPVVQGPSYIPLGALAFIGGTLGLSAMIGSLIPGAILLAVLGYFKLIGKIIEKLIPPIVAGTVILVIGVALMPVAMKNVFYSPVGDPKANLIIAGTSALLLVIFLILGGRTGRTSKIIKLLSVLLALTGGTIVAAAYGMVDFSPVKEASWISFPKIFSYGMPTFDISAVLTMVFIYFVILIESTGTWFAVGAVSNSEITKERINSGTAGEGLGCAIGSVIGGMPVTGYSTNAGIIAVTGVASRTAILAAGGILVILGLIPKLTTLISCIPEVVIMGVFAIVTVIIAMNGLRIIKNIDFTERNMIVVGIPVLLAIGGMVIPAEIVSLFPQFIQYLISAGMAIGAIFAVLLNLVLPKDAK
ncbi:solute carrier family 23 protein [Bacillus sp. DTU_2020_1000418_1_SI_GHA_SEK_038]|uniref:uracil-xanthine permease family protein n=1 Tax=Bacillus sp. DTU_2020_1000418_1_SI_GHA_SEK_038 TaxID=3077585 RepID=UPI0028E7F689|nr:solute carrier family 23 protein [Bacillus sp. DTU_2020_1000418_1_SI_GHA_SEK_038]WNS75173.1 solute carrier family 23 protein [Bacillus sp. DTU_2020_1000418_1_SI_GHA_SEK_038]